MIRLEQFTENDFERFISWIDSEEFMYQFAGPAFKYPVTKSQLIEYITYDKRQVYKVIDKETQVVIGHAEINKIDRRNRNARLCRILIADKANRNRGFGKQIINELLAIGFNKLDLHRIDLGVFEFNKSAIHCYERCGFKIESLLRESFLIGKELHSVYNMSIIKSEFNK